MLIGIVGKANVGKSTFFKAATLTESEIGKRPFVTIEPNIGVSYVKTKCPCQELGVKCDTNNSKCIEGWRFVPVKMLDIAGLVPEAHKGKGMGNKFLDDLRRADVLIHILDVAGETGPEGDVVEEGHRNPRLDIDFLEDEIDYWFKNILKRYAKEKGLGKITEKDVEKVFSGLNIKEEDVKNARRKSKLDIENMKEWVDEDFLKFSKTLREISKPIVIAANKIDLEKGKENFKEIKKEYDEERIIPCCAEAELALGEANQKDIIKYLPGGDGFEILKEATKKKEDALEFLKKFLKEFGSTGVQRTINEAIFEELGYVTVYPVENQKDYTDKEGRALPDSYLMPPGSNPVDLAYKVHSDIGDKFGGAVDCKTGKKISKDYELEEGDVIKIITN